MKRTVAVGLAMGFVLSLGAWSAFAEEGDSTSTGAAASTGPMSMEDLQGRLEGMTEQVNTLVTDVDKLKKIKVSGYVQARWETAENKRDTVAATGTGPTITPANNERFYIRRGRLKVTYDSSPLSQAVIYFDGASSGSNINVRLLEEPHPNLDRQNGPHSRFDIGQF